jgi:hypothetical protein
LPLASFVGILIILIPNESQINLGTDCFLKF